MDKHAETTPTEVCVRLWVGLKGKEGRDASLTQWDSPGPLVALAKRLWP